MGATQRDGLFNPGVQLLSRQDGAEDPPSRMDQDRSEIERIKKELRVEMDLVQEPLFGAAAVPLAAGRTVLRRIRERVASELAAAAKEDASQ